MTLSRFTFAFAIVLLLAGCGRGGDHLRVQSGGDAEVAPSSVTFDYVSDIEPIFEQRCSMCHPGAAPGNWLDYQQAQGRSAAIARRVESGNMPPGNVTGMTEEERQMVVTWVHEGAPFESNNREGLAQDSGEGQAPEGPLEVAGEEGAPTSPVALPGEPKSPVQIPSAEDLAAANQPMNPVESPEASRPRSPVEIPETGPRNPVQSPSETDGGPTSPALFAGSDEASAEDEGGGETAEIPTELLSFAEDIQPIFVNRCNLCHNNAALGDWTDFEQAFSHRDVIARRVDLDHPSQGAKMPPGNATEMTQEERDLVLKWIESGAAE